TRLAPTRASPQRPLHQRAQHDVGAEAFLRDRARGGGVPRVVDLYLAHRFHRLVRRGERNDAGAPAQLVREAGVLDDHGPARGEVAGGALAEPAGAAGHVPVLRHAPLALRALDVALVALRVRAQPRGVPPAPAVGAQPRDRRALTVPGPGRDLQPHRRGPPGQVDEPEKLDRLLAVAPPLVHL